MYGGFAAVGLGFVLWQIAAAVWQTGSFLLRGVFLALVAAALSVIINDVRRRQFSLLSRLLVGLWVLAMVLLVIAELFVSGRRT